MHTQCKRQKHAVDGGRGRGYSSLATQLDGPQPEEGVETGRQVPIRLDFSRLRVGMQLLQCVEKRGEALLSQGIYCVEDGCPSPLLDCLVLFCRKDGVVGPCISVVSALGGQQRLQRIFPKEGIFCHFDELPHRVLVCLVWPRRNMNVTRAAMVGPEIELSVDGLEDAFQLGLPTFRG